MAKKTKYPAPDSTCKCQAGRLNKISRRLSYCADCELGKALYKEYVEATR